MCLVLALLVVPQNFAFAQQPLSWEQLDKQLKPRIYHLNVGVKMRLKNGKFVMHSDNTRKSRYPVFSAFDEDFGYRVAGWGSSFPVKTSKKTGNYFITSGHVLATGPATIVECERFFAAMRLYAEQTASHKDVESRYSQLQKIVNMPTVNKNMSLHELATYHYTSEAIWDCYHTYLSIRADKGRIMFKKYLSQAGVAHEVGYFLHAPGPAEKKPLVAQIYKTHEVSGPLDIAILSVKSDPILPIELETAEPSEGQDVQVIGYPEPSDQIDVDAKLYYAPTFSSGRVSRVTPRMLQIDAPVAKGNSGGPVINLRGRVVGVASVRAVSPNGEELPKFAGAVTARTIMNFAPELFGSISSSAEF